MRAFPERGPNEMASTARPLGFPGGSAGEESACSAGDRGGTGLIPGLGRPGEGNGNPLQYSCLKNPMNRGDWQAIVQRVTKPLACGNVSVLKRISEQHNRTSVNNRNKNFIK